MQPEPVFRVNDPRFEQELRARPLFNSIYVAVFHCHPDSIWRSNGNDLDSKLGIDVGLRLPTEMVLSGQEKALSAEYARYNSLTVEHFQNLATWEPGDWFRIACQFYICGYLNQAQTAFTSYVLVNWPSLVLATDQGRVRWQDGRNRDGHAGASFRYLNFNDIPTDCIISRSG